mgnify:CR=1 FL=1
MREIKLLNQETQELVDWARQVKANAESEFAAAQELATKLGAHYNNGQTQIGFWLPEVLADDEVEEVYLEVLTPQEELDFELEEQQVTFEQDLISLQQDGEYLWGVLSGMKAGTRDQAGSFYAIKYQKSDGEWEHIYDPVAYSVPFGVFAPAELYDMQQLQEARDDKSYFARLDSKEEEIPKVETPTNLLQIHPGTASEEGSLRGLNEIYQQISNKLANGEELTPAEENYIGYEGLQLMPIEPTIEYEVGPGFWQEEKSQTDKVEIKVTKPDIINWGYDVVISGSSAVNPSILGSGRPDEFVDLISTLHNFSNGPIKVVIDVVFGHSDNQGLAALNKYFFSGPDMYGQGLDYQHPTVRAILLEMQRRKVDFGVDGVRVDGAQDFVYWDEEDEELYHDDQYLKSMSSVVQEVAGQEYYPWMIFEDGRPWPREDWELASTYRSVIEEQPDIFQWGPLTFAHNTPFLYTFWVSKWWRIQEIVDFGAQWISGCSNHDTLRRGTQVSPEAKINEKLGSTLPEIIKNAYDNPAEKLLTYALFPGLPMDFINASMRAPWSFIRNTDDQYAVKVFGEEKHFLDWQVREEDYKATNNFKRLKELGFSELEQLKDFVRKVDDAVDMTDYDLSAITKLLNALSNFGLEYELTNAKLKKISKAWMEDVAEYCNISNHWEVPTEEQTSFNLKLRRFRLQRPWLSNNLKEQEFFNYEHPCQGTVLYYGLRQAPDNDEQLLFIANMEGTPVTVVPEELEIPNLKSHDWEVAIATPGLSDAAVDEAITLENSQGIVFSCS